MKRLVQTYKCDSCGKIISQPYEEKMKEFYVGCEFDECGIFPIFSKRKVEIQLCEDCYKGLHLIAESKQRVKKQNKKLELEKENAKLRKRLELYEMDSAKMDELFNTKSEVTELAQIGTINGYELAYCLCNLALKANCKYGNISYVIKKIIDCMPKFNIGGDDNVNG